MTSGIYKRTKTHCKNISKSMIGLKRSQKTKDKMSEAAFERLKNGMPQETKDKISKANFNLKRTQKTKDKIKKAMIGKNAGEKNGNWQGEKYQRKNGRWWIWINNERVKRSRYIAEQCLGRELVKGEEVHHINEDPSDDRSENLYLFSTKGKHSKQHALKNPPILISNII